MTDKQTPPDWVLIEAAKRGKYPHEALGLSYRADPTYAALCDMIERYEQPPVDLKAQCAIDVFGDHDIPSQMKCIKAIELYLERSNVG